MIKPLINLLVPEIKVPVKKTNEDLNESIVTGDTDVNSKIFSAAELWNIQRKRRTMVQRRWSF